MLSRATPPPRPRAGVAQLAQGGAKREGSIFRPFFGGFWLGGTYSKARRNAPFAKKQAFLKNPFNVGSCFFLKGPPKKPYPFLRGRAAARFPPPKFFSPLFKQCSPGPALAAEFFYLRILFFRGFFLCEPQPEKYSKNTPSFPLSQG